MNVKKQFGHDRCNGISGIIIFDSTNAIIENCLYSNGCSIANVSGNSKCEAVNILTELYSDNYINPTDKDNNRNERYTRTVNSIQYYFMVWKNSNCEYTTNSLNEDKIREIFTYNIEDNSYINNKSTWVYVEYLVKNFWKNNNNKISTIYQEYIVEKGSITDFPVCKPLKVYVEELFKEERPVLDVGINNDTQSDLYLNPEKNKNYTSCVQMLNSSDETDADDVNNTFIVWSSFLYTDGNEMKWSKFPNVIYNVDFNIHVNSSNYLYIFSYIKNTIPKNLRGRKLNIILEESVVISDVLEISDFFNGEVLFDGNNKIITYTGKCGVVFSNIQFLTIKNLTIKNIMNVDDLLCDTNNFNVCLKCIDIDNLEISGCNVENKMINTFNDLLNEIGDVINHLSINATYLDNIKGSEKKKTVGIYLINSKGVVVNCSFIDTSIGLCVDYNSNIYIEKQSVSDYCIFKNTLSNTKNVYKMIGCCRIPLILFYITGNSKLTTNITTDSPIKYNETGTDKIVLKYSEFAKNENFILDVCDPGSLFDHDYKHEQYSLISKLIDKEPDHILNYGEWTDDSTDGGDPTRVTIFTNSNSGDVNYNNNLKELNKETFTTDFTVTESIANDWYWYSNVSEKPLNILGTLGKKSFYPIVMDGILYDKNGNYGYRLAMIMNSNSLKTRGIEKVQYVLQQL